VLVNANKDSLQANPGDLLIIETPGGGGWGKSADDPEEIS
jgi:N-methylhydantoinase B/oxoprolinase/acetone carboxylase alpha subunit